MRSGLLPFLAVLIGACSASTPDHEAAEAPLAAGPRVLALGDSIPFGWNPLLTSNPAEIDPANYKGYAEWIGAQKGWAVDNASCPGEASGSLVDPTAMDNGCDASRAAFGLHVDWGTNTTQLGFVDAYLRKAIADGNPPKLVTVSIGGNDLLLLQRECAGPELFACLLGQLPIREAAYRANVGKLVDTIASAGYTGSVAFVTTYAPDYSDALQSAGLTFFNDGLRTAVNDATTAHPALKLVVADGFAAYQTEATAFEGKTCATGLLLRKPDGTCDIHPSPRGHEVLGRAILDALEPPTP